MEYVYFFRENQRPYVKIGFARNDVNSRFQNFKMYAPNGAYIVGQISTKDCVSLENKLHKKYNNLRFNGEFFKLTDEEVYNIISKYDPNFGMVYEKINSLITNCDFSMNDILNTLKNMSKSVIKDKELNLNILLYIEPANLEDSDIEYLTNTEILEYLKSINNNFKANYYELGMTLKNLGFIKKSKRINKQTKRVYLIKKVGKVGIII